jgi:Tfp pilus assembly protein PilN
MEQCMSINLLPWREHKQLKQKQKSTARAIICCLSLFILCIITKWILYWDTQHYKQKIKQTEKQIHAIHPQDPLKKKDALLKKLIFFYHQQHNETQNNRLTEKYLFIIADTIPASSTLSKLSFSANNITLFGTTNQLNDIHIYINKLQKQLVHHIVSQSTIQARNNQQDKLQFSILIHQNTENTHDKKKTVFH